MRLAGTSAETASERRFVALYDRCAPPVHAYCRRRVRSDRVDDAVSETFVIAWRRLDAVPVGDGELLWLYRVARNVVRHEWRSTARRVRLVERAAMVRPLRSAGPAEHAVAQHEREQVVAALSLLGRDDAEVLMLLAWERLSSGEIADVLGITTNTASQRISRARRRLGGRYEQLDTAHGRPPAAGGLA